MARKTIATVALLTIIATAGLVPVRAQSAPSTRATSAAAQALTNADIIKLVKLGISSDAIVTKIKSSKSSFDTSSSAVAALRQNAVPDTVIIEMVLAAKNTAANGVAVAPVPAGTTPAAGAAAKAVSASSKPPVAAPSNPRAQFELGEKAFQAKNYDQAMNWYRKAADQGNAEAQDRIGDLYGNGFGVKQDPTEAMTWYRKAADQGYAEAQTQIGLLYATGQGVPQDYAQAMNWYRKAADQGYPRAQLSVGVLYGNGEGVSKDYGQVMTWFRKAADQGYALAQFDVGELYENGKGVPKDYVQAMIWYHKAADHEDQYGGLASVQIGLFYQNGWGVPRDLVMARSWYQKAVDKGFPGAKNYLAALDALEAHASNTSTSATPPRFNSGQAQPQTTQDFCFTHPNGTVRVADGKEITCSAWYEEQSSLATIHSSASSSSGQSQAGSTVSGQQTQAVASQSSGGTKPTGAVWRCTYVDDPRQYPPTTSWEYMKFLPDGRVAFPNGPNGQNEQNDIGSAHWSIQNGQIVVKDDTPNTGAYAYYFRLNGKTLEGKRVNPPGYITAAPPETPDSCQIVDGHLDEEPQQPPIENADQAISTGNAEPTQAPDTTAPGAPPCQPSPLPEDAGGVAACSVH